MQTKDFSTLYGRARALREGSKFGAAQAAFLKAAQTADFALDRAEALQGAADCARLTGDFKASLRDYNRALKLTPTNERALRADLYSGQALAWRGQGQPLPALQGLRQAQKLYKTLKDAQGLAFCHWALGGTLRIAGLLPQALSELKAAERAYAKLKDKEGASYVDCALGGVNRMLGRWAENARYYQRASARMRARQDRFGIAYSYCGLGNAARMAGDLGTALVFFKKAEKEYAKIGDRVSYAYTLWSLATTYKLQWNIQAADQALVKAQTLFRSTGDRRGEAYVSLTKAETSAMSGRLKEAAHHQSLALELAKGFAWEQRHARALGSLLKGDAAAAKTAYKDSASKFVPTAIPANWP